MSVAYDPKVIQKFADDLYSRAGWIVALWVIFLLLFGAGSGVYLGVVKTGAPDPSIVGIFAVIGAIFGYLVGSGSAFKLRLQAQVALCQVAIEQNTRATQ